jgi:hypothetical protein
MVVDVTFEALTEPVAARDAHVTAPVDVIPLLPRDRVPATVRGPVDAAPDTARDEELTDPVRTMLDPRSNRTLLDGPDETLMLEPDERELNLRVLDDELLKTPTPGPRFAP